MLPLKSKQIKKEKIIWAVDPMQQPKDVKNIIKELKVWAKQLDCDIQPVSILSNSTFNFPIEFAFPWTDRISKIAQKSFNKQLSPAQKKDFLPLEIKFIRSISNRKMAVELAKYAENKNALLIFTNTNAKKTWNPFRLGGFAETLVATSKVPVILVNKSAMPSTKIPSILFPTDFSRESKNALMRLVPWALTFNSEVIIFNQVETPNIYTTEFDGTWQAETFNLEKVIKDIELARTAIGNKWSDFLLKQNIKSRLIINRQKSSVAKDILEISKKNNVNLIALASHSGLLAQTLLGSTTKDLLLQAKCPMLIFHRPKGIHKRIQLIKPIDSKKIQDQKENAFQSEVRHA